MFHDFKRENIAKHLSRNRHWANSESEIPTVRFDARPDIFAPRPSACHDHCSSKRRLRPSGGSFATAPHPVVDVCGVTHFADNPPVLRASSRPASPRSASGAAMAATAMGGARVVRAPKFFAAGSRRTVRGASALRAATRPAAARRSIATVTRAQAGQTAEGENPAPRDPRPLTPRAPGTRSPSFRFFSRPALSDLFPRGPRVPVHSRF